MTDRRISTIMLSAMMVSTVVVAVFCTCLLFYSVARLIGMVWHVL